MNENDRKTEALLREVAAVCRRHGLSLTCYDPRGTLKVERWNQSSEDRLLKASSSLRDDRPATQPIREALDEKSPREAPREVAASTGSSPESFADEPLGKAILEVFRKRPDAEIGFHGVVGACRSTPGSFTGKTSETSIRNCLAWFVSEGVLLRRANQEGDRTVYLWKLASTEPS